MAALPPYPKFNFYDEQKRFELVKAIAPKLLETIDPMFCQTQKISISQVIVNIADDIIAELKKPKQ